MGNNDDISQWKKALYNRANEYKSYTVPEQYERNLYEDTKAMQECIENFYGNSKTKKDMLTGSVLHRDQKAARRKYGKKAASRHQAHPDHDDPLAKIHKRHLKTKYINSKDIREVANRKDNLIAKQAKVNLSKRDDSNLQALTNSNKEYSSELTLNGKVVEVIRGEKNKIETDILLDSRSKRREMTVQAADIVKKSEQAVTVSKEFGVAGAEGAYDAIQSSLIAIVTETTFDVAKVAVGEMNTEEAVQAIGTMVGTIGVTGAVQGIGKLGIEKLQGQINSSILNELLQNQNMGFFLDCGMTIGSVTIRMVNGEISSSQALAELTQKGITMLINTFVQNSCLIGAGSAGIAVFSAIVVSYISSFIKDSLESLNGYRHDIVVIEKIIQDAEINIESLHHELEKICKGELDRITKVIKEGYEMIFEGIIKNDITISENGMNYLLNNMSRGEQVVFSGISREKFRKGLFDRQ